MTIEAILCDVTNPHSPKVIGTIAPRALPPEGTVIVYTYLASNKQFIGRVVRVEMSFMGSTNNKVVIQCQEIDTA